MVLACHVILQDHVNKGQLKLWTVAPQGIHYPAMYNGHRHCSRGDDFMDGSPSCKSPPCQVCWPWALRQWR